MTAHYIVVTIFAVTGFTTLWVSLFNSEWFFSAKNAGFIANRFRRPVARLLYGILALLLLATSVFIFLSSPAVS